MAGDPGHHDPVAPAGVRAGEGRTAGPCAEAGSWRQRVADVRAALPVVERPDVVAPVARSAAFYEFLISAVEKAIFRQSRGSPDPAPAVYAGWARRNRPKCGTVNAIRPRSEL
jgi:hypothetical protein